MRVHLQSRYQRLEYNLGVWIKPLILGIVVLLDLAVIALLGVQWASARAISWNVVVPTIVFNLFGAAVFSLARTYD